LQGHGDALDELCAQPTRDLFAIAKFLFDIAKLQATAICDSDLDYMDVVIVQEMPDC